MNDLDKQKLFSVLVTLFFLIGAIVSGVVLSNESSKGEEEQDKSLITGLTVMVAGFGVFALVGILYSSMLFF